MCATMHTQSHIQGGNDAANACKHHIKAYRTQTETQTQIVTVTVTSNSELAALNF